MRAIAALGAMLGALLLFGVSASAKMAQTIAFTSTSPAGAVAGGSYEASATATSGRLVLLAGGACSFRAPTAKQERLEVEINEKQPVELGESPAAVYFIAAGTCTMGASGIGDSEYESASASQSFVVGKDPSERITFTSAPPHDPIVGGSYNPEVRLSAGIPVSFFTTTPSVCTIAPRHAAVSLVGVGTCTIGARQNGVSESEPPEAQQSFKVYATTSEVKKTRPKAKKHEKAKKCKKDQFRKNGKCAKEKNTLTTPARTSPEGLSATIILHFQAEGSNGQEGFLGTAQEPLRVSRLGPKGEVLNSVETREDTLHVPPGRYEIALLDVGGSPPMMVTVKAGQVLEQTYPHVLGK